MEIRPPDSVLDVLAGLWAAGHAGYIVGGSLRDALVGRKAVDWDMATDARPDVIQSLFPGAVYENRFGTVVVPVRGRNHEITTFRSDHDYADFRRPHRVEFGDTIEVDLARRDFTVNAMAWGAPAPADGRVAPRPALVDPHGGAADLERRILRAVGDPGVRFREDALRMLRAVRFAATLELTIEPETLAAIRANAALVAHLSGERIGAELDKLLAAPVPSVGLDLLGSTGLLDVIAPDLAAQRGIPQNKIPGDDLWAHTSRTVDAVAADRPIVRLAALLHDIGKPATMAEGHFHGHDAVGADLAREFLERIRAPRTATDRIVHLVRHHMFTYDPSWGDGGVRRFIRRIGRSELDSLFALREADNVGSGLEPEAHGLADLRARVSGLLEGPVVLERGDLVVDGTELMTELGIPPGPALGRLLDELLERAIADPTINDRARLLELARSLVVGGG